MALCRTRNCIPGDQACIVKTIVIAVTLSALAAFAVVTWMDSPAREREPAMPRTSFDASLPADARIAVLEEAVSQERAARQLLQDEVLYLSAELDRLKAAAGTGSGSVTEGAIEQLVDPTPELRPERFARRNSAEGRIEQLIQAGFDPGLAGWVIQREEELQMEDLKARYYAGQSGDPFEFYRLQASAGNALREELGDANYERYLAANGRPTSVTVSGVIGSSPAQAAGVLPGDAITSYDGKRVFSMTDINMASLEGIAGENVILDISRDGVPMQLVIPRGPLGISGGRSRGPR